MFLGGAGTGSDLNPAAAGRRTTKADNTTTQQKLMYIIASYLPVPPKKWPIAEGPLRFVGGQRCRVRHASCTK